MIHPHNGNRGPVLGRSVEQPRPGLPDGKVRCPACETIVSLTSKGRLWIVLPPEGRTPASPRTGHCHSCDKPVTGERAYCGRCLSKRL